MSRHSGRASGRRIDQAHLNAQEVALRGFLDAEQARHERHAMHNPPLVPNANDPVFPNANDPVFRNPSTLNLLTWFGYGHLPLYLQPVSSRFHQLANELTVLLPDSPELRVALRKLLESKDCAVRAAVAQGDQT